MYRTSAFGMVCMLILVGVGITMLVSPQPPRWTGTGMQPVAEILKMAWSTPGGIVTIIGGLIVGSLSIRGSD